MSRYIVRVIRKRTPEYIGTYAAPSPVAALSLAGSDSYFRKVATGRVLAVTAELLPADELTDLAPRR